MFHVSYEISKSYYNGPNTSRDYWNFGAYFE
ncbi:gp92 [Erwinia phage vB_EamM-Y2]|uniref:Gp02 n=1 Tax=Erwinia phage vB_EamM-Y2 TaxID=1051676 RepID=G0YQ41_9CAUD|nr:gp02 [Erwinia phage vB_EamM-Y2]YP_007004742.1 gp92 [Erwinia phage vB_EamM-Y2]AEJ81378.1 gp02 [Erwinia phage vB_EamM-Y2]AEJ81468.1 gp92 [Erwinia phage vB_EamM-Y2]